MAEKSKITPSLEDYLEAIYHLEQQDPQVRLTDVSKLLGVAKPSVNKAISLLKERDCLVQERYGAIHLTPEGQEIARRVLERHTTIRAFLTDVLKVDAETADREACLIEHTLSDDTFAKLKAFYTQHKTNEV